MLDVDPDKYTKYYTPKIKENSHSKKPQFIWDQLYYNFCVPLTSRQYRRQLTRGNRNYPYEEIYTDLNAYNVFTGKLLPQDNYSPQMYFNMSIGYYVLESYKRIDFMFKLVEALSPDEIMQVDRTHFLVKRFAPPVLVPYIQDGELNFHYQIKYYRPLFMIEDAILKKASEDSDPNYKYYESLLRKYQFVRAKAYELFKYHGKFKSEDYREIKGNTA